MNPPPNCLRRIDGILTQRAGEALVLFNLETGQYFSINEVGQRVWELCDGTRSREEIVGSIAEEFDAPPATVEADVGELLKEFLDEKLVEKGA